MKALQNIKLAFAANNRAVDPLKSRQSLKVIGLVTVALVAFYPEFAAAAPWDGMANWVLGMLTGGLTRTIAIIAVIGCGIAAFSGRLEWSRAIAIGVGCALIFGSAAVVDAMIGATA
jgi:type IV secretory pathway VirB2 component (pilin)